MVVGSIPAALHQTKLKEWMRINPLIFLSNELLSPTTRMSMRLPLTFVTYAIIEAQMYSNVGNDGVVNVVQSYTWGNNVVYGAIFQLGDPDFHLRTLDAMHQCSLSTLRRNHVLDTQHRVTLQATPISFSSIDALERLMYAERSSIEVQAYIGNLKHTKLNRRIKNTNSKRIMDNILVEPFLELVREETH